MRISLPVGSFSLRCIGHYSLEDGLEFANPPANKKEASLIHRTYVGTRGLHELQYIHFPINTFYNYVQRQELLNSSKKVTFHTVVGSRTI
jgi:hypothetical protein